MYEEKKSSISFRDLAIQLLFIVLFVLILLWIFPTKKSMKEYVDKKSNKTESSEVNKNNNSGNNSGNTNGNSGSNANNGENSENKVVLYEYSKVINGEFGPWSEWTVNQINSTNTIEVETVVRQVQTGTKDTSVQVGTKMEKYLIGSVTENTNEIIDYKEEYLKTETSASVPKSTNEYKYVQIGSVTNNGQTLYTYNVYKLTPIYNTKVNEIYGEREVPVYETKSEPIYQNVTYYRYREIGNGTFDVVWSDKENDQDLIASGYEFTGNVKEN